MTTVLRLSRRFRRSNSRSREVHVGADVVVKLIAADGHTRLDREIALALARQGIAKLNALHASGRGSRGAQDRANPR
ncbi:hypothetical protein ACFWNN_21830 [Lentzea sp. NPDC058450]|uniref:hypothetical protein n=1 Tax=Lentzea sp. NPDC058450 TaxID=3346505 RepID=UPI003648F408